MLADKEVAVVEGCRREVDEDLLGARGRNGNGVKLEAGGAVLVGMRV